jgi:hypothetical protein
MNHLFCPECERLYETARNAVRQHIGAQGNWQIASLQRDSPETIAELRTIREAAARSRASAASAYREHAGTHAPA